MSAALGALLLAACVRSPGLVGDPIDSPSPLDATLVAILGDLLEVASDPRTVVLNRVPSQDEVALQLIDVDDRVGLRRDRTGVLQSRCLVDETLSPNRQATCMLRLSCLTVDPATIACDRGMFRGISAYLNAMWDSVHEDFPIDRLVEATWTGDPGLFRDWLAGVGAIASPAYARMFAQMAGVVLAHEVAHLERGDVSASFQTVTEGIDCETWRGSRDQVVREARADADAFDLLSSLPDDRAPWAGQGVHGALIFTQWSRAISAARQRQGGSPTARFRALSADLAPGSHPSLTRRSAVILSLAAPDWAYATEAIGWAPEGASVMRVVAGIACDARATDEERRLLDDIVASVEDNRKDALDRIVGMLTLERVQGAVGISPELAEQDLAIARRLIAEIQSQGADPLAVWRLLGRLALVESELLDAGALASAQELVEMLGVLREDLRTARHEESARRVALHAAVLAHGALLARSATQDNLLIAALHSPHADWTEARAAVDLAHQASGLEDRTKPGSWWARSDIGPTAGELRMAYQAAVCRALSRGVPPDGAVAGWVMWHEARVLSAPPPACLGELREDLLRASQSEAEAVLTAFVEQINRGEQPDTSLLDYWLDRLFWEAIARGDTQGAAQSILERAQGVVARDPASAFDLAIRGSSVLELEGAPGLAAGLSVWSSEIPCEAGDFASCFMVVERAAGLDPQVLELAPEVFGERHLLTGLRSGLLTQAAVERAVARRPDRLATGLACAAIVHLPQVRLTPSLREPIQALADTLTGVDRRDLDGVLRALEAGDERPLLSTCLDALEEGG